MGLLDLALRVPGPGRLADFLRERLTLAAIRQVGVSPLLAAHGLPALRATASPY